MSSVRQTIFLLFGYRKRLQVRALIRVNREIKFRKNQSRQWLQNCYQLDLKIISLLFLPKKDKYLTLLMVKYSVISLY